MSMIPAVRKNTAGDLGSKHRESNNDVLKGRSSKSKSRKVSFSAPAKTSSTSPTSNLTRPDSDGNTHEQLPEGSYVEKYRRKYPEKELTFTDKDRAAAMAMGTKDIKVSLQVKKKREKKQDEPGEREYQIQYALVEKEIRNSNPKRALLFINKALEFRPKSTDCFVARSKCNLLLGHSQNSLEDAEKALNLNSECVKGMCAKANALYALGDFEHALVYYHRGYHLRPEMEEFRLGIQKAEEVIQNIISYNAHTETKSSLQSKPSSAILGKQIHAISSTTDENVTSIGNLQQDVDFFNSLIANPEIRTMKMPENRTIENNIKEVLKFLEKRQEFWSQQRPRSLPSSK